MCARRFRTILWKIFQVRLVMLLCLVKRYMLAILRELNIECDNLLIQPTVFGSALSISEPSFFTSLMHKSNLTEFKFM